MPLFEISTPCKFYLVCNYKNGKVKAPHIIWLTFRGLITRKLQGGGHPMPPPTEIGLKMFCNQVTILIKKFIDLYCKNKIKNHILSKIYFASKHNITCRFDLIFHKKRSGNNVRMVITTGFFDRNVIFKLLIFQPKN